MIAREHRQSPRCTQPAASTPNLVMHTQSLERAAPSEKGNPGRWVGSGNLPALLCGLGTYPRYPTTCTCAVPTYPGNATYSASRPTRSISLSRKDHTLSRMQTPESSFGQLPDLAGLCLSGDSCRLRAAELVVRRILGPGLHFGLKLLSWVWFPENTGDCPMLLTARPGQLKSSFPSSPRSLCNSSSRNWRCHHNPRRSDQIWWARVCSRVQPPSPPTRCNL